MKNIRVQKQTRQVERMEWIEQLRRRVIEQVDYSREICDQEIYEIIDQVILRYRQEKFCTLENSFALRKELFYSLRKLGVLQELIDDSSVTEIMINGTERIFYEKDGRLYLWDKVFSSKQKLEDVIQQMVAKNNRMVNEAEPIVDTRLENGSRVNVVLSPLAINGPIVTIRRFPDHPIEMKDLIAWGSISAEAALFLQKLVAAKYNIFISGGTGSGKTTFLNVLSNYIPSDERVVTIEDSAELILQNQPNLVRLETRNSNGQSTRPISIRELIKTSLRMRPDRIIVGEVRGEEAVDMLQALNTGHDGSLSTGHANSSHDALMRLETMVLMGMELPLNAIRRQIASGIDIIVHLGRLRDKSRKVLEIVEVMGCKAGEIELRTLYQFYETKGENLKKVDGCLVKKADLTNLRKLEQAGITPDVKEEV